MRTELKKIGKKNRNRYEAKVNSFRYSRDQYRNSTIELTEVFLLDENGNKREVADHVWMYYGTVFEDASIDEGDIIHFDAGVKEYKHRKKGNGRPKKDYKLAWPSKVEIINNTNK